MRYTKEVPGCEWPECSRKSSTLLFNSDSTDRKYLCTFHKRVAVINLENYDRILSPNVRAGSLPTPTQAPTPPTPTATQSVPTQDWEKEAARKADAAAVPLDPEEAVSEPPHPGKPQPLVSDVIIRRRGTLNE